jgi:hypothetical protein
MPKIAYISKRFNRARQELIAQANSILAEYTSAGYDITLRQLYYQFVARGFIENTMRSYKRLGSCIDEARLAGLIDWYSIVDRTRNLRGMMDSGSASRALESTAGGFHLDRWADQDCRVEVWCEKEALIGIFDRVCSKYDVDYFACRGYVSQSEMWRAAMRMRRYSQAGKATMILHFGDHDPSGIDMTRDIRDRMSMFGARVKTDRLALNMDQVDEYQPPENPAKMTDSRFDGYVEQFGSSSWELDALDPDKLASLVTDAINKYRDIDKWKDTIDREQEIRARLTALSSNWDSISDEIDDEYEFDLCEALNDLRNDDSYLAEIE